MKLKQIIEKQPKELEQLVVDQRKALADLVIDMRTKKVSNVKQIASIKRVIAQALTIQRQREIEEQEKSMDNVGETNG